jgi:hypothetical protein
MFTQVFLPLALLAWVAFYPAAGWLAWGIQLISVAAVLLGITLAALWAVPPFWVPYAYGFVLLIVATHLLPKKYPWHWVMASVNSKFDCDPDSGNVGLVWRLPGLARSEGVDTARGSGGGHSPTLSSGALSHCQWREHTDDQRAPQNAEPDS